MQKGGILMNYKYIAVHTTLMCGNYTRSSFGIAVVRMSGEVAVILDSFLDLSDNLESIEKLACLCNELNLEIRHLPYIIDDFLTK